MTWLHRLWRRKRMDEELNKELLFHMERHAADLVARGYAADEAARQARLDLGGPQQVKEACRDARGTRWIEDLLHDLRYALRTLRQRPGFATVTLCTLALGIGATTAMFTVLDGVLLKPLSYPEPERLFALHGETEKYGQQWGFSYPDFLDCERDSHSLAMAAWNYGGGIVSAPGVPEYLDGLQISSQLFSVLGISLARGRAFRREDDRPGSRPVAIISYALWRRRFNASPEAVGSSLTFDGKSYTIVGVAPSGFQLDGGADIYTPLGQVTELRMQNRQARMLRLIARLKPGITTGSAQTELALIAHGLAEQHPESDAGRGIVAYPLRQELVGDVRAPLWLLFSAVALLLLIACVNVASLLLARTVSRERELAMRVALGAGRGRLIRQCLTESAVLGIVGGMLGILLAYTGIRPFVALWPGHLPRAEEVHFDWRVLVFALTASLASSFLFGLLPALRAPKLQLDQTLRAGSRSIAANVHHWHDGFVICEIAFAVVLVVTAGILGRTVLRLSSADPGFNASDVLVGRVALSPSLLQNPAKLRGAWADILERARTIPGVQSVALSDVIPMRVGQNALGYWTGATPPRPDEMPLALASCVTPAYLKAMGIPLRRGRFFDDDDRLNSEPVVVIDDVLARHAFPNQNPVGRNLSVQAMGPHPIRVIGVVGHVRHWGLADDDRSNLRAQIYYPFAQLPSPLIRLFSSFMSIVVRTSVPPTNVTQAVERQVRGSSDDQTLYDIRTMDQLAGASLATQRFLMLLIGIFAGLALLLACIGIYGVLAYVTSQRVPEIGVRMALGATAGEVMGMILGQSLRLICSGVAIGVAMALVAAHVLEQLVAGVRSFEPLTFALMICVLMGAALTASFVPARRASLIDPLNALRRE